MSILLTILQWLLISLGAIILIILISLYIRGAFRDRVQYKVRNVPVPGDSKFPTAIASISNSFITSGMITDLWADIDEIQKTRLEAIYSAQNTIHFETFFMTPGKRANDFASAIADRASAGVEVKLMVDSYGSHTLPKKYWKRLESAGVKIQLFNPFNWKAPANFAGRTHRKLLIIDGKYALIGGAGISDHWDGLEKIGDTQPWFDTEVRIEGEAISILEGVFMQHWAYSGGTVDLGREIIEPMSTPQPCMLLTAGTNPTYRFSPIKALLDNSLSSARERIWLASPYFLPDHNSRQILIAAKQQGVDVKILTTSGRCDKSLVYYASYENYGDLLEGGVEIYEYQPSMLHAKILLLDDRWVVSGSANFDSRSLFHNDELDYASEEPDLVKNIQHVLEEALGKSQQVHLENWHKRSMLKHRIIGRSVSFVQWQL